MPIRRKPVSAAAPTPQEQSKVKICGTPDARMQSALRTMNFLIGATTNDVPLPASGRSSSALLLDHPCSRLGCQVEGAACTWMPICDDGGRATGAGGGRAWAALEARFRGARARRVRRAGRRGRGAPGDAAELVRQCLQLAAQLLNGRRGRRGGVGRDRAVLLLRERL